MRRSSLVLACLLAAQGCTVGQGWGLVEGCIHLPGCNLDPDPEPFATCSEDVQDFRFRPDFFAAEAFEDGSLAVRLQDGGYHIGESDGFLISIPDRAWAAEHVVADPDSVTDGERLAVLALDELDSVAVEERFKVSAYLNGSCPGSEAAFNQGTGTIWFISMYQSKDLGDDRNEPLIHLAFDLEFVDPWPYEDPQPDSPRLVVTGEVRFQYQRGLPAQPFP